MTRSRGVHHEVLLALAEEIRQTLVWLGQGEDNPDLDSVRFRLRTLREAATVAGMRSVEAVLAESERSLEKAPQDEAHEPAALEQVLGKLSSLIVSLAEPAEQTELGWVASLGQVERRLEDLGFRVDEGRRQLGKLNEQHDLQHLHQSLREHQSLLRSWRRILREAGGQLRLASRELLREISLVHRVPLAPTMMRLRERIRRWGRENGKPATLQYSCGKLEVGARQFASLSQCLESLLLQCLEHGALSLEKRRQEGLSTVTTLRVEARQEGQVLVFSIEDDGRPDRQDIPLTREIKQALHNLGARLWQNRSGEQAPGLLLKLPIWHGSFEALPVETAYGPVWIPLFAVERILGPGRVEPWPKILLERREQAIDFDSRGAALLCRLGDWRGVLQALPKGQASRIVPRPAADSDPIWVLGRTADETPIFHPLTFVDEPEGYRSLLP